MVDCTVHWSCESTLGHHTHARSDYGVRGNEFVGCLQRVVRAHKFQFLLAPQVVLVDNLVGHRAVVTVASCVLHVLRFYCSVVGQAGPLNAAGGQPNSQSALCVSASPERLL